MAGRPLGAKAAAVRETIAELCESPPDAPELVEEVADRVRRVVPFDGGAWMVSDPESMLPTAIAKYGGDAELSTAFVRSELLEGHDDVNSFVEMVRTDQTAAGLALTTGGDLMTSKRYRDIHLPYGIHDELRVIARSAGEVWAMGCVSRGDDLPEFSEDEVRWVASIAGHLGQGVRTALGRAPNAPIELRSPGMLVLADDGSIEATTGDADRWLSTLETPIPGWPPAPISAVAIQAQANAAGVRGRAARVRVQMRGGGWLLVHADVLRQAGDAAAKVAVVLEPADRAELLPLLLALHGLTDREREVAELLVSGLSTDEVAARLVISRHTVRDHVKSIFAKVGVGSRPELTAALGLAA
jgi:DNA-binding CsgD family transcriptional regulator